MEEHKEMKRQVLSVREFSEIIGVPESTIRRWLQKGDIRGTQIGRKWLIPLIEVERIVNPK